MMEGDAISGVLNQFVSKNKDLLAETRIERLQVNAQEQVYCSYKGASAICGNLNQVSKCGAERRPSDYTGSHADHVLINIK